MFLRAIELENFKSFGRKTRIELNSGFTVITGPNGSGKSNISDAILFVLGPKSSRVLRAQRLTDLIFNGGKNRNPAKYCKVSLSFDNTDRSIPIDSDIVTFSRVVKLSDNDEDYNSYFYINGEKARLQDFTELLVQVKIFADGYNFVQQGDVTNIVEMTSIERRKILEEIAGITKYDEEIQKAEVRRKNVEENLNAVELLLKEIEMRIAGLARERDIAQKYLHIKEQYTRAKAALEYRHMHRIQSEIEGDEQEILNLRADIEKLKAEINRLREKEESIRADKVEIDAQIASSGGEEVNKLRDEINNYRIELGRHRMKLEDLDEKIKTLKSRIVEKTEEVKNITEKLKVVQEKIAVLSAEKDEKARALDKVKKAIQEKDNIISKYSSTIKSIQHRLLQRYEELEVLRKEYTQKLGEAKSVKTKLETISELIAKLEDEKKEFVLNINDAEWRINESKNYNKSIEKEEKQLQELYFQLSNSEKELKEKINKVEKEIITITKEYERIQARLDNTRLGPVFYILSARDHNELSGIIGTVSELVTVPEAYKTAIDIAAGGRFDSIVVENDSSATKAIEYLKLRKLGRATFLPLNKMLKGRPRGKALVIMKDPDVLGFAIELIKYKKEYEAAVWYVFGDTVVVKNMEVARKFMGGVRMVTLDGQLFESSGAIIGGSVKTHRSRPTLRDLENVGKRLREKNEYREKMTTELQQVSAKLQNIVTRLRELHTKTAKAEIDVWERTRAEYIKKLKEVTARLIVTKKEQSEYEKIHQDLVQEIAKIKTNIESVTDKTVKLQQEIEKLTPDEIREELNKLRTEEEQLVNTVKELTKNLSTLNTEFSVLTEKHETLSRDIEQYKKEYAQSRADYKTIIMQKEQTEQQIKKLMEVEKSFNVMFQELLKKREVLDNKILSIEREISKREDSIDRKEDFIISLNTRIKQNRAKYTEISASYQSYGINIELPVPTATELKKIISNAEQSMKDLEPVNMKALNDYKIEKSKYDTLKSNFEKLKDERAKLLKLVTKLNEKKKTGLLTVFNAIRANYLEIYRELSDGGEAQMYLENEQDPFAGGLIIKIKPIGKKFVRLESLSGGEKSLAALTFIFAIQKYDPSPIYVLDEVDMFLDSINAENVATVIKAYAKNAQVLVMSLREVTLNHADYILGVTSAGDGLSRVFTQSITSLNETEEVKNGT